MISLIILKVIQTRFNEKCWYVYILKSENIL